MKPNLLVSDLLQQLKSPFTGEAIFDQLPDIVYFLKNAHGEYVVVNRTLVERCGLKEKSELLGRTPSQLYRSPLGESYEAQDRWVLKSARPLLQQLVKLRIDHAQRRLTDSDDPISEIALESGYADQSAFTRQFKQATGLTPRQFRQARRE